MRYKAPERVRIVDGLPVTVTGKPQKFVTRGRMVEHGYAEADPCGHADVTVPAVTRT